MGQRYQIRLVVCFWQSYKNIELIIVDGASTDNLVDIIKRYQDKLEGRLRYQWTMDKDAMNKDTDVYWRCGWHNLIVTIFILHPMFWRNTTHEKKKMLCVW